MLFSNLSISMMSLRVLQLQQISLRVHEKSMASGVPSSLLGNGGSVQKKIIQILVFIKSIEKGKPTVLMSL